MLAQSFGCRTMRSATPSAVAIAAIARDRLSSAVSPEVGVNAVKLPLFRSEEHTSELQSLMRISYAVFCLKKKKMKQITRITTRQQQMQKTYYNTQQHKY